MTSYLRACKEINEIFIATNGTIIPSDELMRNFAVNGIEIRVSNYNLNRRNLEAFVAKAQAYGVEMTLYDFATGEALWYDCGGLNTPREDNDAIVAERFAKCEYSICLTLENGELHRCSRAVNAHRLQGFDNLPPPADYVYVRGNENLRRDLLEYFSAPHFETACRYCNGTANTGKIPAAEQI